VYTRACSGLIRAGEHKTCIVVNRRQRIPSGRLYDLTITKDGQRKVAPSASATWDIVVSNLGPSPAPRVGVADRIPAGFRFVQVRGAACEERSTIVVCRLGTLRSGARRTLHVTLRAPRAEETAPTVAAVLGTSLEATFHINLSRMVVHVVRSEACPPGTRMYQGACHAIVAGQG